MKVYAWISLGMALTWASTGGMGEDDNHALVVVAGGLALGVTGVVVGAKGS